MVTILVQVAIISHMGKNWYVYTKRESFLWGKGGGAQSGEVTQLVAQPGILFELKRLNPGPIAGQVQSPNHWTAREFPR